MESVTGHRPGGMPPGRCASRPTGDFTSALCFGAIGELSSGTDKARHPALPADLDGDVQRLSPGTGRRDGFVSPGHVQSPDEMSKAEP